MTHWKHRWTVSCCQRKVNMRSRRLTTRCWLVFWSLAIDCCQDMQRIIDSMFWQKKLELMDASFSSSQQVLAFPSNLRVYWNFVYMCYWQQNFELKLTVHCWCFELVFMRARTVWLTHCIHNVVIILPLIKICSNSEINDLLAVVAAKYWFCLLFLGTIFCQLCSIDWCKNDRYKTIQHFHTHFALLYANMLSLVDRTLPLCWWQ